MSQTGIRFWDLESVEVNLDTSKHNEPDAIIEGKCFAQRQDSYHSEPLPWKDGMIEEKYEGHRQESHYSVYLPKMDLCLCKVNDNKIEASNIVDDLSPEKKLLNEYHELVDSIEQIEILEPLCDESNDILKPPIFTVKIVPSLDSSSQAPYELALSHCSKAGSLLEPDSLRMREEIMNWIKSYLYLNEIQI